MIILNKKINGNKREIFIIENIDEIRNFNLDVIIIANSAKDHFKSCMIALSLNISFLVEKPIATTLSEVRELINKTSTKNPNILKVSNIFLFNDYLINFKKILDQKCSSMKFIKLTWLDKQNEVKNGILKTYDPTIPIYIDCMHHIVTILSLFVDIKKMDLNNFFFMKGGSYIKFSLSNQNIDISINLARNMKIRSRKLEIISDDNKKFFVNFSKEPGFISFEEKKIKSDLNWEKSIKPLQKMLECFLKEAKYKKINNKLDFHIALDAAKICNDIEK